MTEPLRQFVVFKEGDDYVLKVFVGESPVGRIVAAHKRLDAVRVAIPLSHQKANVPVDGTTIEVWIDKRVAPDFGGDRFVCV